MRPVLLGMNNPQSQRPEHALFPHPPGCTGHRLWQMLNERTGCTRRQYLDAFERRNMLTGPWNMQRAKLVAPQLVEMFQGRVVVVLGSQPRRALGLEECLIHPVERDGVTWRQIPHPSGLNRWYNDETNRRLVAMMLEDLYDG